MALTLLADYASPPSGFSTPGTNGIAAAGGIGVADDPDSLAATVHNTLYTESHEAAFDLSFTSFAPVAVFLKAQSDTNLTADRYLIKAQKTIGSGPDKLLIIKRTGAGDVTLDTFELLDGKIASTDQIKGRAYDAGTVTVVMAYYNGYFIGQVKDASSPIQGNGFAGAVIEAGSAGMGLDNFKAGNMTVKWVCRTAHTNPTQNQGVDNTDTNIGGSGKDRGHFDFPFLTFKFGVDQARMTAAGHILVVRGDNHTETMNEDGGDILWRPGSDDDNRTTIISYPGESATNTSTAGTSVVGFSKSTTKYIDWINISGVGAGRLLNSFNSGMDIRKGASFIRVIGGSYSDYPATGAISGKALASEGISNYHIEFIGVHMHHNGGILPNPGEDHGFYFSHPGTIFKDCEINDNATHGIQIQPFPANGDARADNCIVRRNRIHHNGGGINDNPGSSGGGMLLSYGDNCLIVDNLIYRNRIGIAVSSNSNNGAPPSNTLIYHNTSAFTTEGYGISIGVGSGSGADTTVSGTLVTNNVLWSNNLLGVGSELTSPPPNGTRADGTILTANLNDGNDGPDTDPLFVDPDNDDYHLQAGSPCIGAAQNIGPPYDYDLDGRKRPASGGWTQGAYEFEITPTGVVKRHRRVEFSLGFGF